MPFQPTGFSWDIFNQRYAFTKEETWDEMSRRVARQMASAESPDKIKKYEEKFHWILNENLFMGGGRIMANSGRNKPQLLNCFVLASDLDSKEGWGNLAKEMIITSMEGGGCGIDFSAVRPRGADISGSKGAAPGAVELMKLIDGCASPIRAGGARRVALMFSLDLDHPDIMEFLDAKLTKGMLTNANVSVRSKNTSDFIKAVKNDEEWELSWKGKYKSKVKAKDLWNKIVQNAWKSAEPGFLNWELVAEENTINYVMDMVCTNPCGEIAMASYDACCLGSVVLPRFVKDGDIDWPLLAEVVRLGVRFLDNVLTVNQYPLPEMKAMCEKLRRIGLGATGLADTLAMLNLRYGSEDGNKFIDKLYRFISKQAYEASVMLAIEKGPFPLFNADKHLETGYMKRMTKKIRQLVKEHGIRNCAILTQAPTGTISIASGNCSSGIEPMFAPAYERSFFEGDVRKTELVLHPLCEQFIKEGKDVSHFVGAGDLTVREHMMVQRIVQKYIDNAVSKTINMPEHYPIEDMSEVWLEFLPHLKGTTFYRENSRKYIDKDGKEHAPPLRAIPLEEALKRRENEKATIEAAQSLECATGVCDIPVK
jgi:ribonucleoside-diphosphate reductase alpha chain